MIAGGHKKRVWIERVGESAKEAIDTVEDGDRVLHSAPVADVVRIEMSEYREVVAVRDGSERSAGVFRRDFRGTGIDITSPGRNRGNERSALAQRPFVANQDTGRVCGERKRPGSPRPPSSGLHMTGRIGVGESDGGAERGGTAEEVLGRKEFPQRSGYPRAEMAAEQRHGVGAGEQSRLAGATLRAPLNAHRGVDRADDGGGRQADGGAPPCRSRSQHTGQSGRAASKRAQIPEVRGRQGVAVGVVGPETDTVEENEEDTGGPIGRGGERFLAIGSAQISAPASGVGAKPSSHAVVRSTAAR